MADQYMIRSAFNSPLDEFDGSGKRPVVLDIIGPNRVDSLLPPGLKMVLHVNPTSMGFTYAKTISRQQTLAGWVEYHWGSNPTEIAFNMATGGFVRLYSGLSNITGPTPSNNLILTSAGMKKFPASAQAKDVGGTRRDTIAYDKYLDMLALFHNNGAIYDSRGNIAFEGQVLITYDGGSWWGWFTTFTVEETAEKPYQFSLTANFTVDRELHRTKSVYIPRDMSRGPTSPAPTEANPVPTGPMAWDDGSSLPGDGGIPDDIAGEAPNADAAIPRPPRRSGGRSGGGSRPVRTGTGATGTASPPSRQLAPVNPPPSGRTVIGTRPDGSPIYG